MQLDAEDDANAFYKPPVEPAARASAERLSGEANVDSQQPGAGAAGDESD